MSFTKQTLKALPKSRVLRTFMGISFVIMGFFGFLPILGFWMIPMGLLILSVDFPVVRRWRRRMAVWSGRMWAKYVTNRSDD